jgi:hypothetical protein
VKTAPGLIVIAADFRFVRAFPVLNDGSALDRLYHQNAERILLQSVAAATMSAHLAAAALGYAVWWITAIGQDDIQKQVKPLLGVPDELSIIDVMCFGPPLKPSYKRWKKRLDQIASWDRFDPANLRTRRSPGATMRSWHARWWTCGPSTASPTSSRSCGGPRRCGSPSISAHRRPRSPTTSGSSASTPVPSTPSP